MLALVTRRFGLAAAVFVRGAMTSVPGVVDIKVVGIRGWYRCWKKPWRGFGKVSGKVLASGLTVV